MTINTTMTITEITIGEKEKYSIPTFNRVWIFLITLPFRLLHLFFSRKHDYFEVPNSEWSNWYPFPSDGHNIQRKIYAETGFDNCIKFYLLRTEDERINDLLNMKIFGDYHWEKDYGIFPEIK